MGLLTTLFFVEFEFKKNGQKYKGRANLEKGLFSGWMEVSEELEKKLGATDLIITTVTKLE